MTILRAALLVAVTGLDEHGVRVVGEVPAGLPSPVMTAVGDVPQLLLPALGVLLVGYTDNVLTARAFAHRTDPPIDGNRELLALGASNAAAGLVHGFPVSSSGSRTAIAAVSGGRTQVQSLVAVAAACVLLFAHPLLTLFPATALGALVIYTAVRLVDMADFRRLAAFHRRTGGRPRGPSPEPIADVQDPAGAPTHRQAVRNELGTHGDGHRHEPPRSR
ncbi:SulP family inorganic anion transporter [Thermomonospora cellulosilytica]|uniref:MFS superfamily sulfate permease-like transporter n=1 Tax=Thermomonospora cellulosilytica TaxID=1411118 RepID=A0A7W3R714_9ACTN|nr:SulP family inorganic anion transporter [Thermomonospora cellulosilytica]MBA9002788.1 MFS superfamily sulfate permease-like transporter [Thermomonospora cellulosilytica]